jgi:NhaB family Na+:H+ antiporter
MALPYTITMSIVGFLMVKTALVPATDWLYENHYIEHHSKAEIFKTEQGGTKH